MRDARLLIETLRLTPAVNAERLAPAWSQADAGELVELAEHEGVAIWLHRRVSALGIMLAGDARAQLAALTKHATAKMLRLDAATSAVVAILDAATVPFVPLKGAAVRRIAARVPYVDARAPLDVDLLVPESEIQRAWDVLVARGYSPRTTRPDDGHHLPALYGANGVGVELHRTTTTAVAPPEAWRRAVCDGAIAHFDSRWRAIPGDTELLWHAVTHAMVTAELAPSDGLRLRYWLDAAALLAAGSEIDWGRVRSRLDSAETSRPALVRAWLRVASELAGRELPADALGGPAAPPIDLERMLSWRLRVLARHAVRGRWSAKLIDEAARGEVHLPYGPDGAGAALPARLRHGVAVRTARLWWRVLR